MALAGMKTPKSIRMNSDLPFGKYQAYIVCMAPEAIVLGDLLSEDFPPIKKKIPLPDTFTLAMPPCLDALEILLQN